MLIPPDLVEEEATVMEQIRNGKAIAQFETERLKKNGKRFPISLTVSGIKDAKGNLIGVSKIGHDISMRKKVENALKELSPYLNEIFIPADYELIDVSIFKKEWMQKVERVFGEATLEFSMPKEQTSFGKQGNHTPHLNALLADMQFLQRTYPNASW